MTQAELAKWKDFVDKNLALQRIKKSKSKWTVPVFFIKKKDRSLRLVQDYCEVNKWTKRDNYPLPRIEQILEQLHGKVIFTALNIWDGYNNIQVHEGDSPKLAFKGPDGVYEPGVMFFGMTNAPATF